MPHRNGLERTGRAVDAAMNPSYVKHLAADLWCRATAQARAADAAVWWRWSVCLLAGYGVSCLVAVVSVRIVRSWVDEGLQAWDERWLEALAASWFSYPAGLWFEAWGSSAFLLPMLLVAVVLLVRGGYVFRALTLIVGYLSTKGLVLGAWQLWDRARPELIAGGIAAPGLHSYPSGHAVNAVVMFGLIGVYWWRVSRSAAERVGIVMTIALVVLLTCIGRVRLGTHWPSDIIGGLVIGLCWLFALGRSVVIAEQAAQADAGDV